MSNNTEANKINILCSTGIETAKYMIKMFEFILENNNCIRGVTEILLENIEFTVQNFDFLQEEIKKHFNIV